MSTPITVGIAGITGKQAQLVAQYLLEKPDVTVRGYARDPSKLPASLGENERLIVIKGEASDRAAALSFVQGCDVVLCCYTGPPSVIVDGQKILVDACEESGVPRYIASDFTIDFTKFELGELPIKDPSIIIRSYIQEKKNVEGVHILNGALLESLFSSYFHFWSPEKNTVEFWGTGEEVWELTTYETSARFAAEVAVDRQAKGVMKVLSERITINKAVETMSAVMGRKVSAIRLGSVEELDEKIHKMQAEGKGFDPECITGLFCQMGASSRGNLGEDLDTGRYPNLKIQTFEDFARTLA